MIAENFDYVAPRSLDEALQLLSDPGAKVLAGGMSLIPMMKLRLAVPDTIVDLRHIPGLNSVREEAGRLHIGSMVTHYEIETSPAIRFHCPLLAETAVHIGDVQVRNVGTIGGSVAHADPAADYPAALQALEARITIAGPNGQRELTAVDFFIETLTTALEPGELIVSLSVPSDPQSVGSSYQKCVQPASGFALVGIAARIARTAGAITMARIGVTGLAGKSYRATNVEAILQDTGDVQKAAAVVADGIDPNSDIHASAEYRAHLARIYTARALTAAISRIA